MKKYQILLATGIIILGLTGLTWACPGGDPNDPGVCDTLYIICHDSIQVSPPPWEVHFPLLVTHDLPDIAGDSIGHMRIPLKVTHTNPAAYCSLTYERNTLSCSDTANSIFRHFAGRENYMMNLYEKGNGEEWDTRILDLGSGNHFWFSIATSGTEDQQWGSGSQILLATMTLFVGDTMTVCIDTTFTPIPEGLRFGVTAPVTYTYIPQHKPVCAKIRSGRGDANGDGSIDLADVLYLINYLYKNGAPPDPLEAGDVDCDGIRDLIDILILINYLYKGGPPPGCS